MKKDGLGVWGVARSVTASAECDRFACRRGPRRHHPQFKPEGNLQFNPSGSNPVLHTRGAAHSAHPFHPSPPHDDLVQVREEDHHAPRDNIL